MKCKDCSTCWFSMEQSCNHAIAREHEINEHCRWFKDYKKTNELSKIFNFDKIPKTLEKIS